MSKTMKEMYEEIREDMLAEYHIGNNPYIRVSSLSKEDLDIAKAEELANTLFKRLGSDNNGGSTDYYKLPENAIDLQDLIEYKALNFAQGNILKAIYRANNSTHSSYERDLNKIIWFAQRELERIK